MRLLLTNDDGLFARPRNDADDGKPQFLHIDFEHVAGKPRGVVVGLLVLPFSRRPDVENGAALILGILGDEESETHLSRTGTIPC